MIDSMVSEAVRRYIISRQSQYLSANTITFYKTQLRTFSNYCSDLGWFTLDITPDRLVEYLSLRREHRKPTTLEAEFRAIHAFLTWCIERKYCNPDTLDGVKWPKAPKPVIEPFTQGDVRGLLREAAKSPTPERDVAILLLMADCGLRASELCGLKDSDVRETYIHVHGKGGKERRVPIAPETLSVIRRWQKVRGPCTYLFISQRGKPFTREGLRVLFKRLGKRAGVVDVRCSPHTLRHTTAQEWLDGGGDLETLRLLLGHARLETTMRYLVVGYSHVARKHKELSLGKQLLE